MDLAVLCVMWSRKQHQLMPFGYFQFTQSSSPPSTPHPYIGVLVVITSKKLSKMASNSASYSFNNLSRQTMNSYRTVANCMQGSVFLLEIQHFTIKIVHGRWLFSNPVTYIGLLGAQQLYQYIMNSSFTIYVYVYIYYHQISMASQMPFSGHKK